MMRLFQESVLDYLKISIYHLEDISLYRTWIQQQEE